MTTEGALYADLDTPHDRLNRLLRDVAGPGRVIDLSSAIPNWEMPEQVASSLRQLEGWSANAPSRGTPELVNALKAWLWFSFALNADEVAAEVIPTAGSREGLASAIATFLHASPPEKRTVIIPDGSYHAISGAVRCANGGVYDLQMDESRRLSEVLSSLEHGVLHRASVIVFPFPASRSTSPETVSDLKAVLEMAQSHNVVVIADECMLELYGGTRPASFLDAARDLSRFPDHLVVSSSLSKRSFVTGLRSACLVASKATSLALNKVRKHISPALPAPVQKVSALLWLDRRRNESIREHVSGSRRLLMQICAGRFDVSLPACGLYGWIEVDDDLRGAEMAFGAGVRTMPASLLFPSPTLQRAGALRVALDGNHASLAEGLELFVANSAHRRLAKQ